MNRYTGNTFLILHCR